VTAVHAGRWSEGYAYDPAGNLVSATPGAAADDAAGDREHTGTLLRRAGRTHYTHDEQGRVVRRRQVTLSGKALVWHYTWDADDRLVAVTTPDGRRWRYRYDALGRRVGKQRLTADGRAVAEQTDFVWDGAVLAERFNGGHVTTWDYEPGTFRPIAQSEGALPPGASQDLIDRRFYAIVTDLIGTPTELVDAGGNIAARLRTTLWGSLVSGDQAVTCPLRFPGQYHDAETGLHYNFQRYYDPAAGRYQSPDPLGLAPAPDPHMYVPNPTLHIDPLGLAPYEPDLHVALGLSHTKVNYTLLEDFAKEMHAILVSSFPHEWMGVGFKDTFMRILRNPNVKFSFNLTHIDDPYSAAMRSALNGGGIGAYSGNTNWELYQIKLNPEVWPRITFYRDGDVVDNPFE
jgi:RHS repeat-associated protein